MNPQPMMASRVSARVGIDPITIAAIIGAIVTAIQACKKPANKSEVQGLLVDVSVNHPDKCPLWLRHCFRKNHINKLEEIHETWSVIADEAVNNPEEVAAMMLPG